MDAATATGIFTLLGAMVGAVAGGYWTYKIAQQQVQHSEKVSLRSDRFTLYAKYLDLSLDISTWTDQMRSSLEDRNVIPEYSGMVMKLSLIASDDTQAMVEKIYHLNMNHVLNPLMLRKPIDDKVQPEIAKLVGNVTKNMRREILGTI